MACVPSQKYTTDSLPCPQALEAPVKVILDCLLTPSSSDHGCGAVLLELMLLLCYTWLCTKEDHAIDTVDDSQFWYDGCFYFLFRSHTQRPV